eukprot:scaffold5077_cov162-Skeletonema_dohrnii-CCMP3373.AAC.5
MRSFNYTVEDEEVPDDATHVTVDQSVRVIPAWAFSDVPNIVEVICDVNVKGVERSAVADCPSLRRVIMPGVEVVEDFAFYNCPALMDVECGKLEIIKEQAFFRCRSLRSINLLSAKVVERFAFADTALTDARFGSKLDRIERMAFLDCPFLERITIPLKDGLIADDNIFSGCANLRRADLVEGPIHETVAALQLEEWRNDMNEEIVSINQILPTVDAGGWDDDEEEEEEGGKALVIRMWIRSVIGKIIHYQAEHQRLLDEEVATTLQLALPRDIWRRKWKEEVEGRSGEEPQRGWGGGAMSSSLDASEVARSAREWRITKVEEDHEEGMGGRRCIHVDSHTDGTRVKRKRELRCY